MNAAGLARLFTMTMAAGVGACLGFKRGDHTLHLRT